MNHHAECGDAEYWYSEKLYAQFQLLCITTECRNHFTEYCYAEYRNAYFNLLCTIMLSVVMHSALF
jgi:hypothetical protein